MMRLEVFSLECEEAIKIREGIIYKLYYGIRLTSKEEKVLKNILEV